MSFTVRRLDDEPKKKSSSRKRTLITLLGIGGSLVHIFSIVGKRRAQEHKKEVKRSKLLKRFMLVLIAVLCALLVLSATVSGLMGVRTMNFGVNTVVKVAGTKPPVDEHGFTNILLLGQGHNDHDGKDLTDTIMVASIDATRTKSVVLLSLPRDLYFLRTEKMGKGKLNSMYRDFRSFLRFQKGMEEEQANTESLRELAAEIGRNLGLEMHHYVKVDFVGFTKAVDLLEGIDIDVPYDIVDTEYPDENFGYETFSITKGPQTLDGETALKYARSRHTTSDFGRSARQQQILASMAEKAKQLNLVKDPTKIASLYRVLSDHVSTSMSLSDMIGMAQTAQEIDRSQILTMQLNDRNGLYDAYIEPGGMLYTPPRNEFNGVSVLLPVSIPEFPVTWKQPKALVNLLIKDRSLHIAKPSVAVLNSASPSGSARRLGNELTRYGITVTNIDNAPGDELDVSFVGYKTEEDKPTAESLATVLNMTGTLLPLEMHEAGDQLTIVLGDDYTYTPLQNLLTTE